jgi:hypothetical protein
MQLTVEKLVQMCDSARERYGHPMMASFLSGYIDAIYDVMDIMEDEE